MLRKIGVAMQLKIENHRPKWKCKCQYFVGCSSICRSNSSTGLDADDTETEIPPHCHITIRCTREIAGFNGLGEAVKRLDFRSSVRDRRRFQYVCSLLRLLVSNKGIASLPGSAQRMLLQMLEEVAAHGKSTFFLS